MKSDYTENTHEYCGSVSVTARISFNVKANTEEEATNQVLNSTALEINLIGEDGEIIDIDEYEWDLIHEVKQGNVLENNIRGFKIYEV